jgi:hypothetical protein
MVDTLKVAKTAKPVHTANLPQASSVKQMKMLRIQSEVPTFPFNALSCHAT